MCLILFAYQPGAQRSLVIAANRDEFFARPALGAHWWDGGPNHRGQGIYGGRDLEAQGAWLAASADGRLAAVTNWTEDRNAPKQPGSRGDLAYRFLSADVPARDFVAGIDGSLYAGFNFIAYDGRELVYTSNRTSEIRTLQPGVYGLTNTRLGPGLPIDGDHRADTPHPAVQRAWPKAVFGAKALKAIASTASAADLIALLAKPHLPLETPADRELAPERSYSPCFIHGAEYGTRASTAIIVERDALEFVEQQYEPFGKPGARAATTITRNAPSTPHTFPHREERT